MNAPETILPPDRLAALVDADTQRQAARIAQEAFARVFRLSVAETESVRRKGVQALHSDLSQWAAAADDGEAHALRLALLLTGMDQWGLVWSQAFGLVAIPGLSELVGALRTSLDETLEARFLRHFEAIGAAEANAIDFKVELRRGLHLALWHSSIVTETRDEALRLAGQLAACCSRSPVRCRWPAGAWSPMRLPSSRSAASPTAPPVWKSTSATDGLDGPYSIVGLVS